MAQTVYDFEAVTLGGKKIKLSEYRGKTLLIVNTASKCAFTSQYENLERLYKKYKDHDLVILGFPCNQFGNQEPGTEKDIQENCLVNYGVSFPVFSKVEVNGPNAHPLFNYLKDELPGFPTKRIKWNFTKFLVNRTGKPIKRFAPFTKPEKIEKFLIDQGIV